MSPRLAADPRVNRTPKAVGLLCQRGEHEPCDEWLNGADFEGVYAAPVEARRCGCGCHVDPWPFEHVG